MLPQIKMTAMSYTCEEKEWADKANQGRVERYTKAVLVGMAGAAPCVFNVYEDARETAKLVKSGEIVTLSLVSFKMDNGVLRGGVSVIELSK